MLWNKLEIGSSQAARWKQLEAVEVQEEAEVVEVAAASHQIVQQPVLSKIKEPGVFEPRCSE